MRKAAILFLLIFVSCSSFRPKTQPKSRTCDFGIFWTSWLIIQRDYIKPPVLNKTLFLASFRAIEEEANQTLPPPEYQNDEEYLPRYAWEYYKDFFGKEPPVRTCQEMIRSMVGSLQSRHSGYLSPDMMLFREILGQRRGGIGLFFIKNPDMKTAVIYKVWKGSLAAEAGLAVGDQIIAVDNRSVADFSAGLVDYELRGQIGAVMMLSVQKTDGRVIQVFLERENMEKNVHCEDVAKNTAYCALTNFNNGKTALYLLQAAQKTSVGKSKRLVIDLRFNHGGKLNQAILAAYLFTGSKTVVIAPKFAHDIAELEKKFPKDPPFPGTKIIILVNAETASASEIMAGALQDYGLAKLVGETTYGKGEVQKVVALDDGSLLIIVSDYWRTPAGRLINNTGFTPDYPVKMEIPDLLRGEDKQLQKAIELLK